MDRDQNPSEGQRLKVLGALVAAMAVIGIAPILVRWAGEAPALAVVAWRTAFAAAMLLPVALLRGREDLRALSGRDWLLASLAGVFVGLHFTAWTVSIYHTSVASASVLVSSSPIFIAVLGWLFLRERLSRRSIAAIAVGVAGAAMIALADTAAGDFPRAAYGNMLALSGAFFVAVYFLVGRAVRQRATLLAYLVPVFLAAAATTWIAVLIDGTEVGQPPFILLLCFLLALGPQIISHGAFNYAVRFVPAALVGLTTLSEPVVGSMLAFAFFAELPPPLAILGGLVVLGAIVLALGPIRSGRGEGGEEIVDG